MTNMELYGTNDVPQMSIDFCNKRICMLKDRLRKLQEKPFIMNHAYYERKAMEAIEWWRKMRDGEEAV